MHYYQFNIGDYASHTRHLSLLEDLAYRRLLDAYYLHEKPLDIDSKAVARQIGMRDHGDVVDTILNEFFELIEGEFVNRRADKEIQAFKGKIEQASRAGKASAERRSSARSTDVQPNIKQEPLTIKQETITKERTATRGSRLPTDWKPNADLAEWSKAERPDLDLRKVFAEFKDYWSSIPGSKGVRLDWDATWRNWVRKQTAAKQTYAQVAADVARTTTPPPANQDAALKNIIADRENCSPPPEHIRAMMKGILGVKNA
jgi:uncharacterized protein YdaU (DUF1376 family)